MKKDNQQPNCRLKDFGFTVSQSLKIGVDAGYKRAYYACRKGYVECKQVGRTWLVSSSSMNEYLKGKDRMK